MKTEKLVQHLADAVRRIGYTIRTEEGNFRGGRCTLVEEHIVFVNRRMTPDERAGLFAQVLAAENLDGVFLLPEVRAYVEKSVAAQQNRE